MRIPHSSDFPFTASGNGNRVLTQDLFLGFPDGQKAARPETKKQEMVQEPGQIGQPPSFDTPPERKTLTADDANQAKMLLFDDNAKNGDKIQRFKQIHEKFATPESNVLDELELPPVIRNTVDLAIQNPKQSAFAAELLGAALAPDTNDDSLKRRLGILAGTNAEARKLLAMFKNIAEQSGGDPYEYLFEPKSSASEAALMAIDEVNSENAQENGSDTVQTAPHATERRSGGGGGGGGGGGWDIIPESPGLLPSSVHGLQSSVPALAWRNKEEDYLTPEQQQNMNSTDKLAFSLGRILGDSPLYAVGGAGGSAVAGPAGTLPGAFLLTEGMRAYYLDAIRNGEIKNGNDVLRRIRSVGEGGLEGTLMGVGTNAASTLGKKAAQKLGLEIGGTMALQAGGEVAGLTGMAALLEGKLPSADDFQHNAALILTLRGAPVGGKNAKALMTKSLQDLWRQTGVTPEAVSKAAKKDAAVESYLRNPNQEMPAPLADEVQKAIIFNDARSVKMTFTETGTEPSITVRPELRQYLNSLKGEEMAAMKSKDPAAYLATLKSIVRKVFPKDGELQFRTENGKLDYEHLLTDEARSMFVHTLPKTLKDHDIKVEFTTKEGLEKAYLIKKYFDPVVQKDMWDVLVFHQAELRTKLARNEYKGLSYVESIITKSGKE